MSKEVNMKAAVCTGYGSPDQIKVMEVKNPKPKKGEVLIKVMASSVNSGDVRLRGLIANPLTKTALRLVMGFNKPRKPILGVSLAGVIVSLGEGVTAFKLGDEVYAMTGMRFGGHAEYAVLSEKSCMWLKPKSASFEEAAVLPFGGTTALHFLQKAGIQKNQKVMIYGASGAVGTSAVQVAKYLGCHVTAVCSGRHAEKIYALGADVVIDYKTQDFTRTNATYDIIFDSVGKVKEKDIEHLLTSKGVFTSVAGHGVASEKKSFLETLNTMFEEGQLKAVIDRTFTLDDIVAAHEYVDQGVKTGNVVVRIVHEKES